MPVNLGTKSQHSSARREKLTHVAAELGMRVTAWVTPRPGADKEPEPIAHVSIDYGDDGRGGGLGMTVTDPELLIDAGMALIQAGQMLRKDQEVYRNVGVG